MNVKLLEQKGREVIDRKPETKTTQEDIQKKMREEKQREEAAKIIQASARKYLSKKLLGDYRAALNNYKAAQATLQTAEQGLTAITEKLQRRCAGPKYTSQPSS
jgi:replication-associated recombination protein RarA